MAAWLFVQEARSGVLEQVVAASFMTLSILTVPHMTVPAIVAFLFGERSAGKGRLEEPSMSDEGSVRVPAQG
jgi:hypothetical protein